jgi:cell division protein FtsB
VSGLDELTREELIALVLKLHETVQAQQAEIAELRATVERQAKRIAELEDEVARLRGGGASNPLSIRPNVPRKEKPPRRKRKHSFARKSLPATQVIYHAIEECPDCGRHLSGGSVKWRHQVLELPKAAVEVTDHIFVERYCGVCRKRHTPDPSAVLAGMVVGKKSVGLSLMSLVGYLKTVCRVPVAHIRKLLDALYGLRISAGEIAEICHDVAELGESVYQSLLQEVRGSPVVHADETGWREDGIGGYIWSFSTPSVRYYTYRHSRGSAVAKEVFSEEFCGTLVADFYAAYNFYDGPKQRCWVHMCRALKELVERNPDLPEIADWVASVMEVYHRARESLKADHTDLERSRLKAGFEFEVLALCKPYIGVKTAVQRVLSERMEDFIGELFTFVADPTVPSENNAAERAVRPAVVARKISGGSRSGRGSKTCSVLRTLFETWSLQGANSIDACRQMLASASATRPAAAQ